MAGCKGAARQLAPRSSIATPHSSLLALHSSLHIPQSTLSTPHTSHLTPHSSLLTPHSPPHTPPTPYPPLPTLHYPLPTPHSLNVLRPGKNYASTVVSVQVANEHLLILVVYVLPHLATQGMEWSHPLSEAMRTAADVHTSVRWKV